MDDQLPNVEELDFVFKNNASKDKRIYLWAAACVLAFLATLLFLTIPKDSTSPTIKLNYQAICLKARVHGPNLFIKNRETPVWIYSKKKNIKFKAKGLGIKCRQPQLDGPSEYLPEYSNETNQNVQLYPFSFDPKTLSVISLYIDQTFDVFPLSAIPVTRKKIITKDIYEVQFRH